MKFFALDHNPITIFDGSRVVIQDIRPMREYPAGCTLAMVILDQNDNKGQEIPMIIWHAARPENVIAFCPADWQSIPGIYSSDDVVNTNWIEIRTGSHAIMVDGLPRVIA